MVRCRRLLLEHVECSSSDDAFVDCVYESILVDDAAACTVHDAHAALHHLELLCANHMPRLRRERRMNRHEVGVPHDVVYAGKRHTELIGFFFRKEGVIAQNVHAECLRSFGDFAANPAHADDT